MQDLYLRELKNYKPSAVKASDSEGHVQKFSPPKAPQSPEESDIANDLKAYEQQQVEVEGQSNGGDVVAAQDDVCYCAFISMPFVALQEALDILRTLPWICCVSWISHKTMNANVIVLQWFEEEEEETAAAH